MNDQEDPNDIAIHAPTPADFSQLGMALAGIGAGLLKEHEDTEQQLEQTRNELILTRQAVKQYCGELEQTRKQLAEANETLLKIRNTKLINVWIYRGHVLDVIHDYFTKYPEEPCQK